MILLLYKIRYSEEGLFLECTQLSNNLFLYSKSFQKPIPTNKPTRKWTSNYISKYVMISQVVFDLCHEPYITTHFVCTRDKNTTNFKTTVMFRLFIPCRYVLLLPSIKSIPSRPVSSKETLLCKFDSTLVTLLWVVHFSTLLVRKEV